MKFLLALTLACVVASSYAQCPPNERWRSCKQDQTCAGFLAGGEVNLPPPVPCIGGCRCHTDQLRNNNNVCIWPENCVPPPQECDDDNAVRVPCANRCPGGTCSHPVHRPCPIPCEVNGCECRPGWLKLSSTEPVCVPRDLCGLRLGAAGLDSSASVETEDGGVETEEGGLETIY